MPLLLSVIVLVLVLAFVALIIRNVARYRYDVRTHWYSVGYRDGEHGTYWYSIHNQESPVVINAYAQGFTDGKNRHS